MSVSFDEFKLMNPIDREEHLKSLKAAYRNTIVSGAVEIAKWTLYKQKIMYQDEWFTSQTLSDKKTFILTTQSTRYPTFRG